MRVPELLLIFLQCVVKARSDHVLDANDSRGLLGRVVEDALANFVVEMCAVVVRFYGGAVGFVSVGVEGV